MLVPADISPAPVSPALVVESDQLDGLGLTQRGRTAGPGKICLNVWKYDDSSESEPAAPGGMVTDREVLLVRQLLVVSSLVEGHGPGYVTRGLNQDPRPPGRRELEVVESGDGGSQGMEV